MVVSLQKKWKREKRKCFPKIDLMADYGQNWQIKDWIDPFIF